MSSPLHVAIMGTRGIPASYGGFETFAEKLSLRLVKRGYKVTVYCRRFFGKQVDNPAEYKGVRLIHSPTVRHKYFETPVHALISFLSLWRERYDVVLLCNGANSPFAWIVRVMGIPLVINVDGIERKRAKWGLAGRLWYALGERCSVWFANKIVADAQVISDYYMKRYGTKSAVIAYGGEVEKPQKTGFLDEIGVEKGRYILYVSRLEPENNALGVIEAYGMSNLTLPLVIVGDAPYADLYKKQLHERANKISVSTSKKVIFTGFQFGDPYRELRSHCTLYVQATEVGGTHPALVEAMAYGNAIIANDVPEHREVLGDSGEYYPKNNFTALAKKMEELCKDGDRRKVLGDSARRRAMSIYSWDGIVDQYEELFNEICQYSGDL
ncbi:MAG: DUF1972 domain-containing protein [Candidatus Dadabacteria bacterium]|nr:MAG: DUF1972 domain-containing protein [Candidatus Dadabacteria bacterium]